MNPAGGGPGSLRSGSAGPYEEPQWCAGHHAVTGPGRESYGEGGRIPGKIWKNLLNNMGNHGKL